MANIQINIIENGKTTLATQGCICDRNIDINVDIPTGGGYVPTDEDLYYGEPDSTMTVGAYVTDYMFSFGNNKWIIDNYGDRIVTQNIGSANCMFKEYTGETIPFSLNFYPKNSTTTNDEIFRFCRSLKQLPIVNNLRVGSQSNRLFHECKSLKKIGIDTFPNIDFTYYQSYAYGQQQNMFTDCNSLREIDKEVLDGFMGIEGRNSPTYASWFSNCYVLDELKDLYVLTSKLITSNMFSYFVNNCYRLKSFTFATDNGVPKVAQWNKQTIDLSTVGFTSQYGASYVTDNGITTDKQVKDDATYQALKNDPDWFTNKVAYSRYNHDSAVETINSLPDTSAAGGGNIIKFKGTSGELTDGGAINTLTEEEIAVATAKGWTVQIV